MAHPSRGRSASPEVLALRDVVDMTFAVVKQGRDEQPPIPVPGAMRPFMEFRSIPPRAAAAAIIALERDDDLRNRVAGRFRDGELSEGAMAFLQRHDGWAEQFQELVDDVRAARQAAADADGTPVHPNKEIRRAQRRLALVNAEAEHLRREREAALERVMALETEVELLRDLAATMDSERARAVRDLGEERRRSEQRLEELRVLQQRSASDELERQAESYRQALNAATAHLHDSMYVAAGLLDRLGEAHRLVSEPVRATDPDDDLAPSSPGQATEPAEAGTTHGDASSRARRGPSRTAPSGQRPAGRQPFQPRRGAVAGTPSALMQVLESDHVLVLVDGYNVSKSLWGHLSLPLQRQVLVSGLGRLAQQTGAEFRVIFDGDRTRGPPSVTKALPVRVEFSELGQEADDVIIERAAAVPTARPLLVVTADRRIIDGVARTRASIASPTELKAVLYP